MTYGPCGGVAHDGSCEVDDRRCPFVELVTTSWSGVVREPRPVDVPRIVVDHRPTGDEGLDAEILSGYRDLGVAVLLGDHLDDPMRIDRVEAARLTVASGVSTIVTITGRGRSRTARTELIDGFVELGVTPVLCVTGDHPAARFGHARNVDFTSEGTILADEARNRGAAVAVAESPAAPPVRTRSHRLLAKQNAGADFAILNYAGSVAEMREFAARCRLDGVRLPIVAPVPVMTDRRSVDALAQFPGVGLPTDAVAAIADSKDPVRTGVELAVAHARGLLLDDVFAGVNLSGIATGAGPAERSRIMRLVVDEMQSA